MSSGASREDDGVSERYLAAFSHRESSIIKSVVASVLAGEVSRDAIAEVRCHKRCNAQGMNVHDRAQSMQAVQLASGHLHAAEQDDNVLCATPSAATPSPAHSGREDSHCEGAWAADECAPSHANSIDVHEHDREMQRLLATEKVSP